MLKENNILNADFLDYPIFAIESAENLQKKFIGANKKQIFINIIEHSDRPELLPFLEKILAAAKLNLKEDVVVLPISQKVNLNFSELSKDQKFAKAIFFGQNPKSVGLQIQVNKYTLYNIGAKSFLFVDDLLMIHDDQKLKKLLWGSLKEMFGI